MTSLSRPVWFLASLVVLSVTGGCHNEEIQPEAATPSRVKVSYAQTQCADLWGQARSTQQLATVAQAYLAQQGVTLYQPQARVENIGVVCSACTCPTGLVLEGEVQATDLSIVLALGFKQ